MFRDAKLRNFFELTKHFRIFFKERWGFFHPTYGFLTRQQPLQQPFPQLEQPPRLSWRYQEPQQTS